MKSAQEHCRTGEQGRWQMLKNAVRRFSAQCDFPFPLPGKSVLFAILVIDLSILSLAAFSLAGSIVKKAPVAPPRSPAVLAAYRPPPAKKKLSLLVDDFTDTAFNSLGGITERYANYGAVLEAAPLDAEDGSGTCLQLAYDVSSPSSLCGYVSELKDIDLSRFSRIRFQVRAADGDAVFKIELASGDRIKSRAISHLLPAGLSNEWQTVSLPLPDDAAGTATMRLSFVFDHDQGMPYQGTVYLRHVRLY